jgi:DNA-binding GntR family transcriptional regulator
MGARVRDSSKPTEAAELAFESAAPSFQTKADLVYEQLKGWILSGKLQPGQSLTQEELADTLALDVSRMPLREAIARLNADGLVNSRPHHTAKVAELSLDEMRDIYAAREALESMLAAKAAPLCNEDAITVMSEVLKKQENALKDEDYEAAVQLDRRFHATLYALSGFAHSERIVAHLRELSERYVRTYAGTNHLAAEGLDQHRALLEACRERDPEAVRKITSEHIRAGVIGLAAHHV